MKPNTSKPTKPTTVPIRNSYLQVCKSHRPVKKAGEDPTAISQRQRMNLTNQDSDK